MPAMISLTDNAVDRINALMTKRDEPAAGLRISVRTAGCSGLSYTLEYADTPEEFDEIIEEKDITNVECKSANIIEVNEDINVNFID